MDVTLTFLWSKDAQKGTGSAFCRSSDIAFAKKIYLDQGFLNFKLADYLNVSFFRSICNVTRVEPTLPADDINALNYMLNYNQQNNLKTKLEEEVAKHF